MVVGPLMQGFVLAGIIYWYSKGMMSMINDYYRSEFHRKLRDGNATAIDPETGNYDLDNFEKLIDVENFVTREVTIEKPTMELENELVNENLYFKKMFDRDCYAPTAIDIFLQIIGLNATQQELICWAFKENKMAHKKS